MNTRSKKLITKETLTQIIAEDKNSTDSYDSADNEPSRFETNIEQSSSETMTNKVSSEDMQEIIKAVKLAIISEQQKDNGSTTKTDKPVTKSLSTPTLSSENNCTTSVDIELEKWKLSRASENLSIQTHPWSKYLYYFGYTKIIKDLKQIQDDWVIIRAILRWCSDKNIAADNLTKEHQRILCYAIFKVSNL